MPEVPPEAARRGAPRRGDEPFPAGMYMPAADRDIEVATTRSGQSDTQRKRSLVRPERNRNNPNRPTFHYARHAQQQNMDVLPSTTGNEPAQYGADLAPSAEPAYVHRAPPPPSTATTNLHRTESIGSTSTAVAASDFGPADAAKAVGRDEIHRYTPDTSEAVSSSSSPTPLSGKLEAEAAHAADNARAARAPRHLKAAPPKPPSLWHVYCSIITFWAPGSLMKYFGMPTKARQSAWREKMGLISIILIIGAAVGFLTFGFTETVCSHSASRLRINTVDSGFMIIQGRAYDLTHSSHPAAQGIQAHANVLYPPTNAGGQDGSFLFQNVNSHCLGLIKPTAATTIPSDTAGRMAWYFPCRTFNQDGSSAVNRTFDYYEGYACHTTAAARNAYYSLSYTGDVYFTWDDVRNASRNLVVYNGYVLDLDLLQWIDPADAYFESETLQAMNASAKTETIRGTDISRLMTSSADRQVAKCMTEILKVGVVDTDSVGCISSQVVLYVSLVFIVAIVLIKFLVAVMFAWFLSWRLGVEYTANQKKRQAEIEEWADDIYRPAPHLRNATQYRGNKFFPKTSRFTSPYSRSQSRLRNPTTMASQSSSHLIVPNSIYSQRNDSGFPFEGSSMAGATATAYSPSTSGTAYGTPGGAHSTTSLLNYGTRGREREQPPPPVGALADSDTDSAQLSGVFPASDEYTTGPSGHLSAYVNDSVVPQPPADYQPFNFPLVHTILLVTAYSESVDGLRTTLDSLATTDYPNSHKLLFVVCDGLIKGHGNDMTTPEIALSMMKDFTVPPDQVEAFSYVAVASGSKRHNMAKVYAGFYDYDDATLDPAKQQRVPMICVVKCGTPSEAGAGKPGNRGKRDGQVILMSFFQKVMFDERMTELEYEIFNGIWSVTGISPDFYEIALMVDADTKVYPDSLTHMISCMVHDPEVMGLCGETKIANKRDSWVTMIQVFEYYVSHHLTKAFESVFGGVTCLPGCFCMYRIKAPKGADGFWVPILANPDIVERYSDNVVDTLHKKNLLLLGEDRYLSTLMLRTFPKRKQIFVPQAVCKTQVPDTLHVLLSQRRRWINSTVHNLMELALVNTLCGVFCASMQFVILIELIGTLVLPVALAFTLYVVVIAIVRKPVPVIPLVLLAMILGLPGVLVVITATRFSYVGWMLIYLLALPVWNFLLPINAYWKFDDFSWGETRQVAGGDKGSHDDVEGEFDSSQIVMKRWRDFENERRKEMQMPNVISATARASYMRANPPGSWPNSTQAAAMQDPTDL
ncbi:chitin synthase-domain-containing protein [Dipodascopsis tothii]|uniref:chitin synthase-domain-containing protein n=1 Tax=Dipodascopsis tothii TaxID=44089 RepID=UPI0034CF20DC